MGALVWAEIHGWVGVGGWVVWWVGGILEGGWVSGCFGDGWVGVGGWVLWWVGRVWEKSMLGPLQPTAL